MYSYQEYLFNDYFKYMAGHTGSTIKNTMVEYVVLLKETQ